MAGDKYYAAVDTAGAAYDRILSSTRIALEKKKLPQTILLFPERKPVFHEPEWKRLRGFTAGVLSTKQTNKQKYS